PEGGDAVSPLEGHQKGLAVKSDVVVPRFLPNRGRNRLPSDTGRCQDEGKADENQSDGKETDGDAHGGPPWKERPGRRRISPQAGAVHCETTPRRAQRGNDRRCILARLDRGIDLRFGPSTYRQRNGLSMKVTFTSSFDFVGRGRLSSRFCPRRRDHETDDS